MNSEKLQSEYDQIRSYFKTTSEPFDLLEWDGKVLNVWLRDKVIETYKHQDLKELNVLKKATTV